LVLSVETDSPAGPSIVVVLAATFAVACGAAAADVSVAVGRVASLSSSHEG
jgi:hypothetical protein